MKDINKIQNTNNIEVKISIIMRIGVSIAALFMIFGFIMLLINFEDNFAGLSNVNATTIINGIIEFNPYSYMLLGIFLLLLTPVIRVVSTIILFAKEKNKMYTIITVCVLFILILSFVVGILTTNGISDFL